jgi:hypothetical protein
MRKFIYLALMVLALSNTLLGQNHKMDAQDALQKADRMFFIENKGQWPDEVLYLCRMGGLDAWITKYGMNYTFYRVEKNKTAEFARIAQGLPKGKFEDDHENATLLGHRVLFKLRNHNANPQREGKQQQEGYYNYFIGNDPSKHASFVGLYKEAVIKEVYAGIDMRYYFDKGSLRYDYIVHPGGDPKAIAFELEGQNDVYVKKGNICFTTRFGEVAMAELRTYQGAKTIPSRFEKQGDVWKIAVGNYDKTKDLVIDPLIYSTYLGGTDTDEGRGIAVDGSGNAYVTGWTSSTNYDVTAGAFQTTYGGGTWDVFVTKLNSTGSSLVYSTYLGGNNEDRGLDIAVDGSGNAYVTGYTSSTDYDITTGVFQTTYGGMNDVFVTKLSSSGATLVYSTYIGGTGEDGGSAIAVDGSENAYITGYTASTDYDVTTGAFQTTYGGGTYDVFVTKLNATGSSLVYSTYLGGGDQELGSAIGVDGSGNAYMTGYTNSTNYDVTTGSFQMTNGGLYDVFVTKLNATGSSLVYSTYLGGSDLDFSIGLALDGSGNAYITGYTNSTDYDVTTGAFQTTFGGGSDVFVTKISSGGSSLDYSTYLGGSSYEIGRGIAVDGSGHAYVTGLTSSPNYDVTTGAFQTTNAGFDDVFVTKLNPTGTGLVYSTYIGGSNYDYGQGIAVDGSGHAYVMGSTISTDYDVTTGAFQTMFGGGADVFVTKLNPTGSGLVYSTYIGGNDGDYGRGIAVDGSGHAYVTGYTWSTDYDVTTGAFQTTNGGGSDVFVTKFNPSGSGLVYSTYLGGTFNEFGYGIAVDGSGNAYITGNTQSTDYDVTTGAFQTTNGGGDDVFVTKLNPTGSSLVYSTYLGGSSYEIGCGIAVDGSGNAYVAGYTWSTNYDVTTGAFQTTNGGSNDVFVTKLSFMTTSIQDGNIPDSHDLHLYPNPSNGSVVIEYYAREQGIAEIRDITGKLLQSFVLHQGRNDINLNLPAGMYFLQERNTGIVRKLVIE